MSEPQKQRLILSAIAGMSAGHSRYHARRCKYDYNCVLCRAAGRTAIETGTAPIAVGAAQEPGALSVMDLARSPEFAIG